MELLGPDGKPGKAVPNPEDYPWKGSAASYRFAAVVSENTECNEIGT